MTMQDPIADMLTHIRNAQAVGHPDVTMPSSKIKTQIAQVLLEEGYIEGHETAGDVKVTLTIKLKYLRGKPVIEEIHRASRPGLRIYKGTKELPRMRGGLGILIVSTNQGVLSSRNARARGLGGEVLCSVF